MAHITIVTSGTRGDVEPFINFAISLKNVGFTVRLAASIDFKEWILSHNLEYAKIGLEPIKNLLETSQKENLLHFNIFKMRKMMAFFKQHIRDVLITTLPHITDDLSKETDLIISHVSLPASSDIAEAKNVPLIFVSTVPLAPTKLEQNIMMPPRFGPLSGRFYNQLTHLPVRFSRVFYSAIYKELRKKVKSTLKLTIHTLLQKGGTPRSSPSYIQFSSSSKTRRLARKCSNHWFFF